MLLSYQERIVMKITLDTYGMSQPGTLSEAMVVIEKLLDRCGQLNEIIKNLEGDEY